MLHVSVTEQILCYFAFAYSVAEVKTNKNRWHNLNFAVGLCQFRFKLFFPSFSIFVVKRSEKP